MKLKKITAYIQTDKKRTDEIRMFLPSGYKGGYILVEEDCAYNLGIAYLPFKWSKKFLDAKKRLG
jgi:hypothetical protein